MKIEKALLGNNWEVTLSDGDRFGIAEIEGFDGKPRLEVRSGGLLGIAVEPGAANVLRISNARR